MRFLVPLFLAFLLPGASSGADEPLRGLRVVAKDVASQQSGEVALYGKSFAVVVGIDRYQHLPPDRQLRYAVRDARGVEAVLRKHYRFDRIVTLFDQDATRARILDLLTDELPAQMGENDALFVFFAGHGDQIKRPDGEVGYLIPHDGQVGKLATVISMADLRDTISRAIPAKHVFYVIDACYGGLLTTTRAVDRAARRDLAYLKEITRERVRQVLTAGDKGQEVLDGGPNGHSVFTGRLIEILERTGDFVTANEIQAILREKVFGDARARNHTQTPAYGTLYGSGDFVFVPSLEQKLADNRTEVARLEAELKILDAADAAAKTAAGTAERARLQREADAARRIAEGRLKAEQAKRQQLADEAQRRRTEDAERTRIDAERVEAGRRLGELKARADARRREVLQQTRDDTARTVEGAVAEIRRLKAEIARIEVENAAADQGFWSQIVRQHDEQLAALAREAKDEFETQQEYALRLGRKRAEITRRRDDELRQLRANRAADPNIRAIEERILALESRRYLVDSERITAELGAWDPERKRFRLTLSDSGEFDAQNPAIARLRPYTIDFKVWLPMSPAQGREFRLHWNSGLIRVEASTTLAGTVSDVTLIDDADNRRWLSEHGSFVAVEELARQRAQRKASDAFLSRMGIRMVDVPEGCFDMGSAVQNPEEAPIRRVCVPAFQIGATEVTQGQWKQIMGSNPSANPLCGDTCPVDNINWDDAQQFLARLATASGSGFRLPTEAEWEYACRGGTDSRYCGGDNLDALGWHLAERGWASSVRSTGNVRHAATRARPSGLSANAMATKSVVTGGGADQSQPVAGREANALGIYDMSGNVMEWVADCWHDDYSGAPSDGSARSGKDCQKRVLRGGSYALPPPSARATARAWGHSAVRNSNHGLRIAR